MVPGAGRNPVNSNRPGMQSEVQRCRSTLTKAKQVHMLRLPAALLNEVLNQMSKAGPTLRAERHHVLALQCQQMLV